MTNISDEQLKSLDHSTLIFMFRSLQNQMRLMEENNRKLTAQLSKSEKTSEELLKQVERLTEIIRLANQRSHGRKSEKSEIPGQMSLFDSLNEAEALKDNSPEPEITEVITYKRKKAKGKREEDLKDLPTRIIDHCIPDEELARLFPNGYKELPAESYKRLHVIPETFVVDEHHVHVYASKDNDGRIIKAERPADLFRNSIATPELIAMILNAKYARAIPIERQSSSFKTNGVNLSSNTMANWVIKSSEDYLSLIYDRLHKLIYDNKVIHADETPVNVMRVDDTKSGKKTYMWVYRSRPLRGSPPIVLYDWQKSRKADHPREFLKEFSGTVITDGYQVYHKPKNEREDLKVAGCWIHARRPFAEIIKSVGEKESKGTVAAQAYNKITEIMHEDNKLDDLPKKDRERQRKLILKKKVSDYFEWAKEKYLLIAPNSALGKALAYSINQEKYLRVFLKDGDIPMDNNYAEQAIRPFTIGRKNFVFIESVNGAKASAVIYSIVETAKANNLNTYKYLELLLSELPKRKKEGKLSHIDDLLPWSKLPQKECLSQYKKS